MKHKDSAERRRMARFKWVIGVPYGVQGSSHLVEVPILYFIKFTLGMGDAGGQLFNSLRNIGWFIKPLWGYISDRVALFGYHRKSWFILMALLATVFWGANAALAAIGIKLPFLFLITFNLAFATYAFVDVVCDALMVEEGRRGGNVGTLVNFQWTALASVNAIAVLAGAWLQDLVKSGDISPWLIFMITGLPPLLTAYIGLRNIPEERVERSRAERGKNPRPKFPKIRPWSAVQETARNIVSNPTILLLTLFIFFWNFSPSVGYIERSYLIDVRSFTPNAFGTILSVGGVTFLLSIIAYRWVVKRFSGVEWYHYLYAMVAISVLAFPLSFYFYLPPEHAWWDVIMAFIPPGLVEEPLFGWNRYVWFRLIFQTLLSFATIPAFLIPLTIAGETVNLARAGVGYAFLMALANVTNMLEGTIGAGLFALFGSSQMAGMLQVFANSPLNVAGTDDERTLILQLFVYISLAFTALTVPFVELLRRHFNKKHIRIALAEKGEEAVD